MSGHSHWSSIKHKKAAVDQKRGKIFAKLSRAIMVAARRGADPDMNAALRQAIDTARKYSMPRDNIDRAVKKGSGDLGGIIFQELVYEGYGPGGVAMLVEAVTDKSTRTTPEIRKIFDTRGGNLSGTGSTAWMFKRKGLIGVPGEAADEDRLLEIVLDAGADDVASSGRDWEIICPAESFEHVRRALDEAGVATTVAELTYIADSELDPDAETQKKALSLMEALEDHDDVQNVYAAFTPSDEVLSEIEKG